MVARTVTAGVAGRRPRCSPWRSEAPVRAWQPAFAAITRTAIGSRGRPPDSDDGPQLPMSPRGGSLEGAAEALADLLRGQRSAIEASIHAESIDGAVPHVALVSEPAYAEGMRTAVAAVLEAGLVAIAFEDDAARPHALRDACSGASSGLESSIDLDAVLRRCAAPGTPRFQECRDRKAPGSIFAPRPASREGHCIAGSSISVI